MELLGELTMATDIHSSSFADASNMRIRGNANNGILLQGQLCHHASSLSVCVPSVCCVCVYVFLSSQSKGDSQVFISFQSEAQAVFVRLALTTLLHSAVHSDHGFTVISPLSLQGSCDYGGRGQNEAYNLVSIP